MIFIIAEFENGMCLFSDGTANQHIPGAYLAWNVNYLTVTE